MDTTLVIGGTGFIGGRVVRRLLEQGQNVRCLIRATSKTDRLDGLSVERVVGELRNPESLIEASKGCDAIVHLGGISAWSEIASPQMASVVVGGTKNVLEAAQKNGVRRVIYVSSAAAMGPSLQAQPRDELASFSKNDARGMIYALAKRDAEQVCLEMSNQNVEVVIVRPAEVYGPGDRDFITAGNLINLLASSPVIVCAGGTSVVHVDDVASGIVLALTKGRPREIYLLGGDNLHHRELARLLLELTHRRWPIITVPRNLLTMSAAAAQFCRLPFPIPPPVVPYATRYWFVDNRKSRQELGIQYRSARETLAETLAWLQSIGKA